MAKNSAGEPETAYDKTLRERESHFGVHYKWIALSNTTLGATMAAIDGSILIISLPAIFNGLGINPLTLGSSDLLLWLLLGYTIIAAITVVAIGRLSDMFGRVKLYNLGFLIFTIASIVIYAVSYLVHGTEGALALILLRLVQGLGGGFLLANGAAILTDAFPSNERGMAMGINQIAAVGGSILGLLIGGVLAAIDWHLIFLISVPVGIIGTIWAYLALHELATIRKNQKLDIYGNIVFAVAIAMILLGLTNVVLPYGGNSTGLTNPIFLGGVSGGIILLIIFAIIESRVEDPMFHLALFKIRAFGTGCASMLLAGIARGGLQFMLIIWLQGIWLPLHGVSFQNTPFQSAILLTPLLAGFLIFGPASGYLSDRYGARLLTTLGMAINVIGFLALASLPVNFSYPIFAIIIFSLGAGQGMFAAPNTAAIMSAVPPEYRGVASGIRATIFNLSTVLSIGIFFSLLTIGVSGSLTTSLYKGLVAQNVSNSSATMISKLPPTSALFAALLGYNPMKVLLPQAVLNALPQVNQAIILGTMFFPNLIANSFINGMRTVLYIGGSLVFFAMIFSALRGDSKRVE